ncbi:SRPBCC family protein [Blastococcus xanthinilyticus]|uniref:Putative membrane protein n=1 Tax=Blastococcus xanthinilyticus TaxID=1564164 RepID=A0A5S5D1R8_9ACTN|nr:SRPBCC family protein [Blastococcus xanthinilyticus]TYP89973.1 putative membrane protein [Blastococcus xanthinilyticus]
MSSSRARPGPRRTARVLGLVSTGLGVAMLRDPKGVARFSGVDDSATALSMITVVGARELLHAFPLLAGCPGWAWTRVAGDAMDLTAMGIARSSRGIARSSRGMALSSRGIALSSRSGERERRLRNATLAVAGLAALDLATAVRSRRAGSRSADRELLPGSAPWKSAIDVSAATTVNRPPQEVYARWHDFTRLPEFMAHVREVRPAGIGRWHWVAEAPGRRTVQWSAEVVEETPGERIRWRSLPGADVENAGVVEFRPAPGDQGTEVRVRLAYAQPGGKAGKAVAKLFGEAPEQQVRDDLARFKQILETGQVVRSEGTPEGPLARRMAKQQPAAPRS